MAFNPSQLAVLSGLRSPLKAEPMPAEITAIMCNTSGSGHEQAVVTLTPLDKGVKQESLALRMYISKPDDSMATNPGALNRVKAKGYAFFRAVDKDLPLYPEKVGNGVYQTKAGQKLNWDEYNKLSTQVTESIFARLAGMTAETLAPYVGTKVFMCPQAATLGADKRSSQFVSWIAADLDEGRTFITENLIDDAKLQEMVAQATADNTSTEE